MMATLEAAKDALAAIPGIASCAIGMEVNVSPADYPLIRLVPSRIVPGRPYGKRTVETLVYFGVPISDSEGMDALYTELFAMEAQILAVVRTLEGRHLETITDEDRIAAYKLMAIRCELVGV